MKIKYLSGDNDGIKFTTVLEGGHYAKAAFIISDKNHEISQAIMEQIPRGKGLYKNIIH